MNNENKSLVLIVDDSPHNLQVLGNMLKQHGYHLAFAQNGLQALDFVKTKQPEIILLDIMMPGIDGFEVCRQLKQDTTLSNIPVIFLTAKAEKDSIIQGLELGAVDYITKPFNAKELITRVNTHLELKTAKDVIVRQQEELQLKLEELKQANATKDKFFSIIAHDLKNLFNALLFYSDRIVVNQNIDADKKIDLQIIQIASKKGYNLLKNLLEWSKMQTGRITWKPAQYNLTEIIAENIALSSTHAKTKHIEVFSEILETTSVFADKNMLNTIIRNLLSNAIKFTPENGNIQISSQEQEAYVEISISDTGVGLKPEDIDKLFRADIDHITIGTGEEKGTGLGLILCKEFVEKNLGTIGVESEFGKGSRFYIRLPSQENISYQ